jgi:hypothetical protein
LAPCNSDLAVCLEFMKIVDGGKSQIAGQAIASCDPCQISVTNYHLSLIGCL